MGKVIKTNIVTVVLGGITIISLTIAIMSLINQAKLKSLTEIQSQQIAQLIKDKKDFQFSKTLNDDNSLTAIDELKKMVMDLKNNRTTVATTTIDENVLGVTTSLPPTLGMVMLNVGVTPVNIYDSPSTSGNILSSTMAVTVMFYYEKQPGWYQIEYEANKLGWMPEALLTETIR
jgi:hypothetical protein